jgi:hydroxymethylbilane synthase
MPEVLRIATRGSALALAQTRQAAATLEERNPGFTFEIITFTTTGDRVTDRPLSHFRGEGVFVKEIEAALLAGEADLAVHSLKDVPVRRADGLLLAAFPTRRTPFDCLITKTGSRFDELRRAAVVGTGSPRRVMQLRAARPDLVFGEVRGNLDTRLRKLDEGLFDGIVVAAAGMLRLNRQFDNAALLPADLCLPAAGQGCLAVECRERDERAKRIAATVDDAATRLEVGAERDFLAIMGGGCHSPTAVYAALQGGSLRLTGAVGDPESGACVRATVNGAKRDSRSAGRALANRMLELCDKSGIRIQP